MDDTSRDAVAQGYRSGLGYALRSPRRRLAGVIGEQLGQRAGNSIEFMDYRSYTPGDDLRRIDWAAYARTDRLSIKLYREEVTPHVDLIVDASASMGLADTAKPAATLGLAAALAAAADNARWSRRLFAAGAQPAEVPDGHTDPAGWRWPGFTARAQPDALMAPSLPLRRAGVRVVVSDLLFDADPWRTVSHLASGAAALVVVQVLAKVDADPPWSGDLRLTDAEGDAVREVRLDAGALKRYKQRLAEHRQQWADACRRVEGRLVTVIAETLTDQWDLRGLVEAELLQLN